MNKTSNYTYNDIVVSLRACGISPGDVIFIHSNMGFFGLLKEAVSPIDYYRLFKQAIFEVIGSEGTLVVPTFSYSFCRKQNFDLKNTPGVCGFLSEQVRQDSDAYRSCDANFSVAAIGVESEFFTHNADPYSFGENSFFARFLAKGGKFCNFNFDAGSTFLHYVERVLKVPYRFDKGFTGSIICDGKVSDQKKTFYHFCCDLNIPNHTPVFEKFDRLAKQQKLAITANLGRGQIVSISAQDTFDLIEQELKRDGNFLIRG